MSPAPREHLPHPGALTSPLKGSPAHMSMVPPTGTDMWKVASETREHGLTALVPKYQTPPLPPLYFRTLATSVSRTHIY